MPAADPSIPRTAPGLWRLLPFLALLVVNSDAMVGRGSPTGPTSFGAWPSAWVAVGSLDDGRLEQVRRASATWDFRVGPVREVVDQVAIVPDLAGFLDAIATWDRGHWFPVLIEDPESTPRFLRAFRPSRIIRPPPPRSVAAGRVWDRALGAVRSSWSDHGPGDADLRADAVPLALAPTPPGAVLSSPDAPMLAGAVALAAGRFQPLLRLDWPERYGDVLTFGGFQGFADALTDRVAATIPQHGELGDDCDFLTLAGDWPYRYLDGKTGEPAAVDDAVARTARTGERWAYAGRLLGGPADSAYRAMCGLFLKTDEATLFNGYDEKAPNWSDYAMRQATTRLSDLIPTTHRAGLRDGSLEGWHEAFDPWNRSPLILINSHGSPTIFHLQGGPCNTADVPRTVPSAVVMIHSFAAADPNDPDTIAGRWLANGAFVFFGSMNEPFLPAFRTPRLVADLIAERLPLAAAVRQTTAEPFGFPWRLVYLGDPLYRVEPVGRDSDRLPSWDRTEGWPVVSDVGRPTSDGADDLLKLRWARDAALAGLASGKNEPNDDLIETLGEIRRQAFPPSLRPSFDGLLADVLFYARRRSELRARIAAIPIPERSPPLRRMYESILTIDIHLALARDDFPRALAAWSDLIRAGSGRDVKELATRLVGRSARSPIHRQAWAGALRFALNLRPEAPEAPTLAAELERVGADRSTAQPQGAGK